MAQLNVHLTFSSASLRWALVVALLGGSANELSSEQVTLTTFFPAPSGVYKKLMTTGQTVLGLESGKVGIGLANPFRNLHVRSDYLRLEGSGGAGNTSPAIEFVERGGSLGVWLFTKRGSEHPTEPDELVFGYTPDNGRSWVQNLNLKPNREAAFRGVVSVGGGNPHATAQLQVDSASKGFLPPRLTSAQRNGIFNPARGLQLYNRDSNRMEYWDGTGWRAVAASAGTLEYYDCVDTEVGGDGPDRWHCGADRVLKDIRNNGGDFGDNDYTRCCRVRIR